MKQRDSLKRKKIDGIAIGYHLLLLVVPLVLFVLLFTFATPGSPLLLMPLILVCLVYLLGYSLAYYMHQGRLSRLWQHLEQVVNINDATYELVHLSSQYHDEHAFLDALLNKAVCVINGAEMGSIILVDPISHKLEFESAVGLDLDSLKQLNFTLEQSFEYRLTKGRCDRVVVVDDMLKVNAGSGLTADEQAILLSAAQKPIHSTLSSPIHIDGKLYGMLNLDSNQYGAFSDYDRNLVGILTHEASNAISLYQKSQQIRRLANLDSLTGLNNRKRFEELVVKWRAKPALGSFVILVDMDELKHINDDLGHQQGDIAIKRLANVMGGVFSEPNLLARFGGDEFVILCYGPRYKVDQALEQMQSTLAHDNIYFSFGVAAYELDWHSSFKQADTAMYIQKRAKKSARNSVRFEVNA